MRRRPAPSRLVPLCVLAALVAVAFAVAVPSASASPRRYCGKVTFKVLDQKFKVYAHGVSCHQARHVARRYGRNHVPKHWVCSASLRRCYRHSFSSHHFVSFNRVPRSHDAAKALGPSAALRPRIDKACRSIHTGHRRLQVDLEHVSRRHRWHTSCFTARRVARKYLHGSHGVESVHVGGRKYTCYKSRPDGVGWKYNCSAFKDSNPYKDVAIGIGRRF